jgi:hypothetical protein
MDTIAWRSVMLSAVLLVGCGDNGGDTATDRRFSRIVDPYTSVAECEASTTGTGFNCKQELDLCANGGFAIIVTDIVNEGICVGTQQLTCTVYGSGDLGHGTQLKILLDRSPIEVKPLTGSNPWGEEQLDEQQRLALADNCENMTRRGWWH